MVRLSILLSLALGVLALTGSAPAIGQDQELPRTVGTLSLDGMAPDVRQSARSAFHGEDDKGKDGPLSAVGMELSILYHQQQAEGAKGVKALREGIPKRSKTRTSDERPRRPMGRVLSPISADGRSVTVDAVASGDPSGLLESLRGLGLEDAARAGNVVSGRLPISAIEEAAALGNLRGMSPAQARTTAGSVGSEADTAHAAAIARANTGTDGSGQKICALSDSYDTADAATSAADDIQSGDLPGQNNPKGRTTSVDVLDDGVTNGSDEGRAMLQLIHDIAPGAELGFHTAFGGIGNFAQGIRDLADAGCTVIVDDVGYNIEPFYQDGPVSNAVDEVVQKEGIPYFSSAGNDGQNSYEAPFRDSGEPGVINSSSDAHDFDPSSGTDTRQEITLEAGGNFRIFSFQWTDPSSIVDGSDGADTDIDVALVDETGTIVAESIGNNIETGVPLESIDYTNETGSAQTLDLVIEKAGGPDPEEVKYVYSGSGYAIQEYDTLGPTVYGHPMAEGAMAVAAAPFFFTSAYDSDADPAILESFSSKGGIPLLFNQDGSRRATPKVRQKPDVTGTDGIDNTFFGRDISDTALGGVDPDPHPNFFGTSAAAPNVAAIGALIRQARPGLAPAGVYDRLESTAADVTERADRTNTLQQIGSGRDPWSGAGFVQADQAVPEIENQSPVALADTFTTDPDSTLSVEAPGVLQNDSDPDGDPLEASVTASPLNGELTLQSDGGVEYVPDPEFVGTDRFRYSASDPNGFSDTSEVQILVGEAETPQIATRIVPDDTTIGSGENLTLTQTIKNEATNTAELNVQVAKVPGFLALESSVISEGSGSVDSTNLLLAPEAEAILTYSLEETVESITRFDGLISHDTNDPERPSLSLSVAVTVRPTSLTVDIARAFDEASGPGDYRLVALPGAPDTSLASAVSGEAGAEWQAYREAGEELRRYQSSAEEDFAFQKGRGYWLTSRQEWALQDSIEAASLQDSTTAIPLNPGGWTIVANPFGEAVPFGALSRANGGDLQALWPFGGAFSDTSRTFKSARQGQAYYLFSEDPGRDSLQVPHPALTDGSGEASSQKRALKAASREAKTAAPATIALSARPAGEGEGGPGAASTVRVGIAGERGPGTLRAPPGGLEAVSLRVVRGGQKASGQGEEKRLLMRDRRRTEGEGETFRLRLESQVEGPIRIQARGADSLGSRSAALIDRSEKTTYDLSRDGPIQIRPGQKKRRLEVAIGSESYVEGKREKILPEEVRLTSYPNPAGRRATVEYALPEAREVTLQVYDVLGRRVATLEQGRKKAGRHTARLETGRLSSGVYFGRLEAGGETRTQKITVVR